jgi:hypothetical protein
MNVTHFMRRAAAAAMAVAVLLGATAARAAVVHWTFSGVMDAGGVDFNDTFGLNGSGGFGGQAITGHLFLDTANAPAPTGGPPTKLYENFSGAPWLWGSFTLNGVTRNVGPDFRTYTAVSSSDFGPGFDFLSFDTNADFEQIGPTERLFMRSGLGLQLIDFNGIIVPGDGLPSAFDWTPDLSDLGAGQFSILDQLETLPNGPLVTFGAAQGSFTITGISAVVAVDSPASLPVFAAGLVALALLAGRRMPRLRSNP